MNTETIRHFSTNELTSMLSFSLSDFNITREGHGVPRLFLEHPHSIDGIGITVVKQGSGKLRIACRDYNIEPCTLIVIIPDLIIEPIEKSDDLQIDTMYFSYDFISEIQLSTHFDIVEKILVSPCLKITSTEFSTLLSYYEFIAQQYSRTMKHKETIIKSLVFAFLGEILSLYFSLHINISNNVHTDNTVNSFISLLLKHYNRERKVAFYAEKLCITPKYLMTLIKQKTGKPISVWIDSALIALAKRELKSTDKSIMTIADELNFSSSSQFCRYFKQHTGSTPNSYRNSEIIIQKPVL